jgi:hypothetical protein
MLSNDAPLVEHVTHLYEPCVIASPGPAEHVFILRRHPNSPAAPVSVYRGDRAVLRRTSEELAVAQVVWEVNRGVVEAAGERLLLHAGAAERDGKVVVVAGPEGSGKSTLVDALIRAGLRYVTDETVAVTNPSVRIEPYLKPITLQDGDRRQHLVPAHTIRRDAVALDGGYPCVLMLLAGYQPERKTSARMIPRAEAMVALGEQAFNFRTLGPGRLDVLAGVARASDCYRLEVGDLDEGAQLVLDLLEGAVR